MIIGVILLDVIMGNYSIFNTYFFIPFLYRKSYKHYLLVGLILDLIIFRCIFYNTIILTILYLLNIFFRNLKKNNVINYVIVSIINYILFIMISNIIFNNNFINIFNIIIYNFLINLFFIFLSYKINNN